MDIDRLKDFYGDKFPSQLIISGEEGSGRHSLVEYISSEILHLPLTKVESHEDFSSLYTNSSGYLFEVELNNYNEKEQSNLLKLVEEPPINSYVVIIHTLGSPLINTLSTRCNIFFTHAYTKEELRAFVSELDPSIQDILISLCPTPGQIDKYKEENIIKAVEDANKIIKYIGKATLANTLSIADNYVYYKDKEEDKAPLKLFLKAINYNLVSLVLSGDISRDDCFTIYAKTYELQNRLLDDRLNQKMAFTHFLTDLWSWRYLNPCK